METGNVFIEKESGDKITGRLIITSKDIKYSKLELAWRIGITVAVFVLICLSV